MKMYVMSDSWPFYLQPDGTLTDSPKPEEADLGFDSLEQLLYWDDEAREATLEERKHAAKLRQIAREAFSDD